MDTETIISQIEKFQTQLIVNTANGVEINNPVALSEAIVKIRMLLVQLVNKVADAELEFRRTRAARYDKFIKDGVKKSPASDALKYEQDLIELEVGAERLKNYMRYCDSLVSSVQSSLKVQVGSDKAQY